MQALKLKKIGNSVGIVLPKELLSLKRLEEGDELIVTETPDGFALTPYDPAFEDQMDAARKIMKKRKNALRQLAK